MIGAVLVVLLLSGSPQAATDSATAAPAPQQTAMAPGTMSCVNQGRRNRTCTTADGQTLRCQKQRQLGSNFDSWVCLTYREDQTIQRDSQSNLDHQQRITTPDQR